MTYEIIDKLCENNAHVRRSWQALLRMAEVLGCAIFRASQKEPANSIKSTNVIRRISRSRRWSHLIGSADRQDRFAKTQVAEKVLAS